MNTQPSICSGDRPLPNQLSGSDLDGDMYDIVAFQNLFPRAPFPPMDYNPQSSNKELEHDCRVDDIIDFVLDFILNDTCVWSAAQLTTQR